MTHFTEAVERPWYETMPPSQELDVPVPFVVRPRARRSQARQFRNWRINRRIRKALLAIDPHCVVCGSLLAFKGGQQDSAFLIRRRVICCEGCQIEAEQIACEAPEVDIEGIEKATQPVPVFFRHTGQLMK